MESEHATMRAENVSFRDQLQRAGVLGNKHIPVQYLRAGTQQRIDLLRGLMDADGWWNRTRHRAGFTTTDDRLALGVVELLRTLGINPQHFNKPNQNAVRPGRTWHMVEFTPAGFNPFSLPRKAMPAAEGVTDLQRTLGRRRIIASVEPVESVATQCLSVDAADSMYLCGNGFVPTHNTSSSPAEGFEAKALFQLRVYALIIWRTRGVVPRMLQLVYLGDGQIVRYEPDEADLRATERKVGAIWEAIEEARRTGVFEPSPGRQCDWCAFKAHCPAFGGELLPMPAPLSPWARFKRQVRRRWRRLRRRVRRSGG
jgi:CRISPR/Cas system-associated exonuclease Cas4 (RecB family)